MAGERPDVAGYMVREDVFAGKAPDPRAPIDEPAGDGVSFKCPGTMIVFVERRLRGESGRRRWVRGTRIPIRSGERAFPIDPSVIPASFDEIDSIQQFEIQLEHE